MKNTKSSACTSRVSTQIAHAPFCLCLKLVTESRPPPSHPPPHTYNPQSCDCCRHLSNYRMERGAAEAKPFPAVAYSVTHGQAPVLIKSYSDTGTSSPLFISILRTACMQLKPTAHGRRAVTRHSCLSSVNRFPRMPTDKPVTDFYASLDVTLTELIFKNSHDGLV